MIGQLNVDLKKSYFIIGQINVDLIKSYFIIGQINVDLIKSDFKYWPNKYGFDKVKL